VTSVLRPPARRIAWAIMHRDEFWLVASSITAWVILRVSDFGLVMVVPPLLFQ
jgi:hypothetical protein